MVVSIDIYLVLEWAIFLLSITYIAFYFIERKEKRSIVIRLICSCALVVLYAFKMPMDIAMDNSSANAILMIICWLVVAVLPAIELAQAK